MKEIRSSVSPKGYSEKGYNAFKNKFRFSLTRLYFFFKFFKNSNKFDFVNLIYKYCIGRNFKDHSKKLMKGELDNIDKLHLNKFLKFYNVKKFDLKLSFKLTNKNRVLTIKNEKF